MRFLPVFLACLFSGATAIPAPPPVRDNGDLLITASIGDASMLNPILASDSASGDIVSRVFNGLVKYGTDLRLTGIWRRGMR
jgi:hypothetical protein